MLKNIVILLGVLLFVAGCGCSNILSPPAAAQNATDTWPAFYGTDNGGPDNGYMVFWDQAAAAWQAPRLIAADLLDGQWTPQRNATGYRGGEDDAANRGGQWTATFIEDTSFDLEMWGSPDDGWQDDAGAWVLIDDDTATNYNSVDVESRQNYVWAVVYEIAAGGLEFYIDLNLGVPVWVDKTNTTTAYDDIDFSFVLDRNLLGGQHITYIVSNQLQYEYAYTDDDILVNATYDVDWPQIIVDDEERLWIFFTDSNALYDVFSYNQPTDTIWTYGETLYTATGTISADYHATWLAMDDTIHVALVDFDALGNCDLVYMRRTPNGWTEQEIVLRVDSSVGGDKDGLSWPQITVDPFGNIFIYYIYTADWGPGFQGDLQGFYLDVDDYSNPVAGSWVQHLNIDQSGVDVYWVVAEDAIPNSGEM